MSLDQYKHLYDSAWRTSDSALDCLSAVLAKYKPKTILEFGPGLSSFLFYDYQAKNLNVQYFAIDHVGPYSEAHAENVFNAGYTSLNIHIVPLLENGAYDLTSSPFFPNPDLLFIDGPPSGRLSMLPFFKSLNAKILLIDDTHRAEERELSLALRAGRRLHVIHDLLFPPRTSDLLSPAS